MKITSLRILVLPILFFLVLSLFSNTGFAQRDPNLISSRHYVGFEVGANYSWLGGAQNFYFPYAYPFSDDPLNPETGKLYLTNPGSGFGFLLGATLDLSLSDFFGIAAKVDFHQHSTNVSETETFSCPDLAGNPGSANLLSTFHTSTSYIGLDLLLRLQFVPNSWYGLLGVNFSSLLNDRVSGHETILSSTNDCQFLFLPSNDTTGVREIDIPDQKSNNYFSSSQLAFKLGAGTFIELGTSHWVLVPELQLAVPLSEFIADAYRNAYAVSTPPATAPKQWYVQLTLGLKFPFGAMSKADMEKEYVSDNPAATSEEGYAHLKGKVTDRKTGKPVKAGVTVTDLNSNEVVSTTKTDNDGEYDVRVKAPGRYSVTADADGYLFGSALYEVDGDGRILKGNHNIQLDEASGRTRLLIFFDFNKSDLQRSSYPELERVVHLMKANPTMEVEIAGYTDSKGTDAYNLDLSKKRADAVKEYLLRNGIASNRITAKGYGKDNPISTNDTEEGRADNRRVEFVVLHK